MNSYEKMLAHVWIELNSKINKIESGEISPEDRAKLDAIPASASSINPVALVADIPDLTSLTNRVTAAEGDIDDIQAVIPSGASTSNKLATVSDIPTSKRVETISIILPETGWSVSPNLNGYYTQSYTMMDINFDPVMQPFVLGTNNEFNLISKCEIFNYDGFMNFTAYVKTWPMTPITLDLYIQI